MSRRINAEGLALIKRWEGCRLEAYKCAAGVWTIGYGHTRTARQGLRITQEQAEALLREDLRVFEAAVDDAVTVQLTDNQFAALVSWAFNVGVSAMRSSTLIRKLNLGDYDVVPRELVRWAKVEGKPVHGLANRRAAEAGLWARGAFVASRNIAATEPPPSSPAAEAGKLGGVAAAAAAAAPAITSLGGVHWAVGVALVAGLVALAAVYLLRRREA
jgi:lysozyme